MRGLSSTERREKVDRPPLPPCFAAVAACTSTKMGGFLRRRNGYENSHHRPVWRYISKPTGPLHTECIASACFAYNYKLPASCTEEIVIHLWLSQSYFYRKYLYKHLDYYILTMDKWETASVLVLQRESKLWFCKLDNGTIQFWNFVTLLIGHISGQTCIFYLLY